MNRPYSVYLDLVRFAAACLVYLYHSNQRWLVKDELPLSNYGHSAVIVFFVLSGFVIAYITDTKERDWASYGASRLSRVYSVVLPALLLTLLLDGIGHHLRPAVYDYPYDRFGLRVIGSLLMLNEIWFVSITSFSNVPYWSITYEFWYYVMFGLLCFLPRRWRWPAVAVTAVLLGPKIVLLAPLWAAGVLLYRWRALARMPLPWAAVLWLASAALIVLFHSAGVRDAVDEQLRLWLGPSLHKQLTFSKFFVGDYLLGVLVFANFAAARCAAPALAVPLAAIEKPVRTVAAYTFTLYLLHQPLFLFWGAVLALPPGDMRGWLAVTTLTGLSVAAVGYLTENKRHRMKTAIERWLAAIAPTPGGTRVIDRG